ncbi:ABC transporter permease [Microvirga antarctica]|uniref:ABC transporter permease n=1 Tax=Microvirga antarctica TaxID=2819233 RepID=UPI001B30D11C|nr:ABC transporter permease [Microvirga antarctica]
MSEPTSPDGRSSFLDSKWLPWVTTPVLLLAMIATWQIYVSRSGVSAFILPAPMAVAHAWIDLLGSGRAWHHVLMTIYATLAGFAWALVFGVGLGTLIGRIRWLEATLTPFIVATQVIPKVALVPLFIVWFGFGITSKVIVAAVLAFFPILTNTVLGVKSVDAGHQDVMTSLNASRWEIFRRLELPSSMPYIITGMEVGIVLSLIGAIVGEYLGGASGLGFLLVSRMNAYETDGLFAVMIHMTLLGFVFYFGIGFLRRMLIPWHQSANM